MTSLTERIRGTLVGLRMPRALEVLDQTLQQLEGGGITAIEAIDILLSEEFSSREGRRIGVALNTARLTPVKTLESFDFSFQPSRERDRIMALAELIEALIKAEREGRLAELRPRRVADR